MLQLIVDCVDRNPFCTYWGQTGECQKNPHYMNLYCKLTCDPVCSASVVPVPQPQAKPSSISELSSDFFQCGWINGSFNI